ncbi:MAG: hypothetical protein L3K03_04515 [Thermoplasmata archaeon]|nr:hypothetical protein [Thermoplasmata archaeon]
MGGVPPSIPPPPEAALRLRRSRRVIWTAVLAVAGVVALVLLVAFYPSPPTTPGTGGPLGAPFGFGRFTPLAIPHGGVAAPGCASGTGPSGTVYCERVGFVESVGGFSTADIRFALQSDTGTTLSFASVTLLDEFGNAVAQYTTTASTGSWSLCPHTSSGLCHSEGSTLETTLPAPMNSTDSLVLQITPSNGSAGTSPTGDIFVAFGTGLGPFVGEVTGTCV